MAEAVRPTAGAVETLRAAGNCAHRDKAFTAAPEPCAEDSSIPQWCAPCRRQQNGSCDSSLPGSKDASGPSHSSRVSEMERMRRTLTLGKLLDKFEF